MMIEAPEDAEKVLSAVIRCADALELSEATLASNSRVVHFPMRRLQKRLLVPNQIRRMIWCSVAYPVASNGCFPDTKM